MRARGQRIGRLVALVVLAGLLIPAATAAAPAITSPWKTVSYRGYRVSVPRSWPVYDLRRDPSVCVRFNRHAVYLGMPGQTESCPAHAVGRAEAILLAPAGASAARAGSTPATTVPALTGSATSFLVPGGGVEVTATWSGDRRLIARVLHRRSLPSPPRPRPRRALDAHSARPGARAAQVLYTGPGFDACSAPSSQAMAAWGSSPYRALGIYIGGTNAACTQSNLSSTWISNESAAGWHMIPTYVGLQAPSNSCGCRGISPSQAAAQGTAAAQDAVTAAQALGLPPGTPIYDDMEYYSRTQTNSSSVLAFLSGWTSQLHSAGYLSGVYGNSNSAIADLVAQYGTSYPEPDDIWMANWNGQATTSDPAVPSSEWANHQRLHQYRGGHNESYGGVTINIDTNYLDAATAAGGGPAPPPPPPKLVVSPTASGSTIVSAGWGGPGLASWRVLAGTDPSALTPIASAASAGAKTSITVRSAAPYFAVQALGATGQWLANSSTLTMPPHLLLFGHSVFVGASAVGGVPVGCYLPTSCHLVTTVSLGRRTLVRTGPESLAASGTGLVFFKLPAAGLRLLARSGRLPVQVTVKDVTGRSASGGMALIPFMTTGRAPAHSVAASPPIRPVGSTDFVYARGAGGILTACDAVYACPVSATLSVGGTTIASTRPELVNGRELGYVLFSLTSQGRQLLAHASGNQLGASLVLKLGSSVSKARITLAQFS